MELLGRTYSAKLESLWKTIQEPKPFICEYPLNANADVEPEYAGKHLCRAGTDLVFISSGRTGEYTVAHELMHVILRRNNYPHLNFRVVSEKLNDTMALQIVQQLDSVMLHPHLNRRLEQFDIAMPPDYQKSLISNLRSTRGQYKEYLEHRPELSILWPLRLVEFSMWGEQFRKDVQQLDFPEAWPLANELIAMGHGIEDASPEQCRTFALNAIAALDKYLHQTHNENEPLYADAIMLPPPPFQGIDLDSPARSYFKTGIKEQKDGRWLVEVLSSSDRIVCWSDGPFETAETQKHLAVFQTALDSLSVKDFTNLCEGFLTAVAL